MPDVSLEEALAEAYASAPAGEVILHTLELRHASFTDPIRVVLDNVALNATLEADAPANPGEEVTFIPMDFDFTLPEASTSPSPEIEIVLDNVSAELIGYLDLAANSDSLIEATYRPYLASDTSHPQMTPPITLVIREVEADVFRVRARAGFGNLSSKKFPGEVFDAERFPGLVAQ